MTIKNEDKLKNARFAIAKKVNENLAAIAKKVANVPVPSEGCNWADVGDLEHINTQLKDLVDCFA